MKKVTIYSTPNCHFCHAAKDFFTGKKVEFTDYDVASDTEKRQEMLEVSGQMGVPVITIEDTEAKPDESGKQHVDMVIGFDQPKIVELLGL